MWSFFSQSVCWEHCSQNFCLFFSKLKCSLFGLLLVVFGRFLFIRPFDISFEFHVTIKIKLTCFDCDRNGRLHLTLHFFWWQDLKKLGSTFTQIGAVASSGNFYLNSNEAVPDVPAVREAFQLRRLNEYTSSSRCNPLQFFCGLMSPFTTWQMGRLGESMHLVVHLLPRKLWQIKMGTVVTS